ncbi:hypothetical protein [Streptomyces sp. NPDC020742]|uniref:hypothetical protein n=1 Tax=unclassified Streptomyces TaxID=2593676 RepID=UPI0033E4B60B
MRTQLAAGAAAAVLLTLFGGTAALADDNGSAVRTASDPNPTDHSRWMHDGTAARPADSSYPARTGERYERTRPYEGNSRVERPRWMNDSPLRLTTCALGTALSSLTGSGRDCVADRMGMRVRAARHK